MPYATASGSERHQHNGSAGEQHSGYLAEATNR